MVVGVAGSIWPKGHQTPECQPFQQAALGFGFWHDSKVFLHCQRVQYLMEFISWFHRLRMPRSLHPAWHAGKTFGQGCHFFHFGMQPSTWWTLLVAAWKKAFRNNLLDSDGFVTSYIKTSTSWIFMFIKHYLVIYLFILGCSQITMINYWLLWLGLSAENSPVLILPFNADRVVEL